MLIKATAEDIKKYSEFAYSLALNPEKSCYPTYCDGIKTKNDFTDATEDALRDETSETLLFSVDGDVDGWISYYWIPNDKYIQLIAFNINRETKRALTELLELLEKNFTGYTAYFGYPSDNHEAINALTEYDFKCVEHDWNNSFFFDGYTAEEYHNPFVERILRHNFDKFRAIYHASAETYWNVERIFETIDNWIIFVYNQADAPVATVFLSGDNGHWEVYGIEFSGGVFCEKAFRGLMTASLRECKDLGAKYMTCFCEDECEKRILGEIGFRCVGQYVLYIKTL